MVVVIPVIWKTSIEKEIEKDPGYFFERAIIANKGDYRPIGISKESIENLNQITKSELKAQEGYLKEIIEDPNLIQKILPSIDHWLDILKNSSNETAFLTINEPKCVIMGSERFSNILLMFSKNYNAILKLNEKIKTDFEKLNKVTKDFGLQMTGYLFGEEVGKYQLNKIEAIKSISYGPIKNDFEKEVFENIRSLTNCLLTNIEITYEKPTETFEYDILIPIEKDNMLNIEVTDYEMAKGKVHENVDSLKSQLILSSADKAQRLRATCIIIAKGFPSETFEQMKELATSRNVTLFNEHDYLANLEGIIMNRFIAWARESEESSLSKWRRRRITSKQLANKN